MVSGCDCGLGVEIDILLGLGRYTVLCSLCVGISNVHVLALDCRADLPSASSLKSPSCILCRPQVRAVVFLDDLEISNISKNSSEVPSPTSITLPRVLVAL